LVWLERLLQCFIRRDLIIKKRRSNVRRDDMRSSGLACLIAGLFNGRGHGWKAHLASKRVTDNHPDKIGMRRGRRAVPLLFVPVPLHGE
jgi:hypothetical protein